MNVHPTACVEPGAVVADDAQIGAFAHVEAGAIIGAGCSIGAHAVIHGGARLGEYVHVSPHAVIGGLPQDVHFDPSVESFVCIGKNTTIREGVTVHRSTQPDGETVVGEDVFLMANAHVAHDCRVGEHAILANGVLLGGFVEVGAYAFLGGNAVFQQKTCIGEGVMAGGGGRYPRSLPPFTTAAERGELFGLNLIGLKRRGFSNTQAIIGELKDAYREVFLCSSNPKKAAAVLLEQAWQTAQARAFLEFTAQCPGAIARAARERSEA